MIVSILVVCGVVVLACVGLGFWTVGRVREAMRVAANYSFRLDAERAEVKRLTDIIVQLRERHMELPPEASDQRWGRYVMTDEEALAQEARQRDESREVQSFDQAVRAAVGEALSD